MRSNVTGVPLRVAVALAARRGDGDLALHGHAVQRELPADQRARARPCRPPGRRRSRTCRGRRCRSRPRCSPAPGRRRRPGRCRPRGPRRSGRTGRRGSCSRCRSSRWSRGGSARCRARSPAESSGRVVVRGDGVVDERRAAPSPYCGRARAAARCRRPRRCAGGSPARPPARAARRTRRARAGRRARARSARAARAARPRRRSWKLVGGAGPHRLGAGHGGAPVRRVAGRWRRAAPSGVHGPPRRRARTCACRCEPRAQRSPSRSKRRGARRTGVVCQPPAAAAAGGLVGEAQLEQRGPGAAGRRRGPSSAPAAAAAPRPMASRRLMRWRRNKDSNTTIARKDRPARARSGSRGHVPR